MLFMYEGRSHKSFDSRKRQDEFRALIAGNAGASKVSEQEWKLTHNH